MREDPMKGVWLKNKKMKDKYSQVLVNRIIFIIEFDKQMRSSTLDYESAPQTNDKIYNNSARSFE